MLAPLALALLALLALDTAMGAGDGFLPTRVIDKRGGDKYEARVGIDGKGRATVVWQSEGGAPRNTIRSARLKANGARSGAVKILSGGAAGSPRVAVARSGEAAVVWERFDSGVRVRIQAVRLGANGSLRGDVQTLSRPGLDSSDPQVAITDSGQATVVWRGRGIRAARLSAEGTVVGPVQRLGDGTGEPRLAIDAAGRAAVAWRDRDAIRFTRLGADGEPDDTVRRLNKRGQEGRLPQLAVDAKGRATVVWQQETRRVQSVRVGTGGAVGKVRTLSEAGAPARLPQVAADPRGGAVVVWDRHITRFPRVEAVRLGKNGSPRGVRVISAKRRHAAFPVVAIGASGAATVAWVGHDGVSTRIEATRLGAKRSGAVHTLSAPGRKGLANACCPSVAVDRAGRATLAWVRYDGKRDRIEAARSREG